VSTAAQLVAGLKLAMDIMKAKAEVEAKIVDDCQVREGTQERGTFCVVCRNSIQ
jgi:hypothetical protein